MELSTSVVSQPFRRRRRCRRRRRLFVRSFILLVVFVASVDESFVSPAKFRNAVEGWNFQMMLVCL